MLHACAFLRFLRHDWKSKNISVPPGHRVVLSQFIEKVKKRIMPTPTSIHKKRSRRAEVRCKYSKRVKVEDISETDNEISHVTTNEQSNLLEIAGKIRKQIVKWQNSQKEMYLKQLKEHKDFELKVQPAAGPGCSVDVSVICKTCNITLSLGRHDKPNSFLISNWTRHAKCCNLKTKKEKCQDQRTLNNFLKSHGAGHTEAVTAQSKSVGMPENNTEEVNEISSDGLSDNKGCSTNSTDDNQQVFRLAPPIVHQQ